jgi:hypothetical protein
MKFSDENSDRDSEMIKDDGREARLKDLTFGVTGQYKYR